MNWVNNCCLLSCSLTETICASTTFGPNFHIILSLGSKILLVSMKIAVSPSMFAEIWWILISNSEMRHEIFIEFCSIVMVQWNE